MSLNILIVEDEFIIAEDIRSMLENLGYQVIGIVDNGKKALEILEKESTDLVLMDIKIRGEMNGTETARHIYSRFDIPIIYLTAYADEVTLKRIKETVAYGFIVKPASRQTIQGTIELAIYKHDMDCRIRERDERLEHLNRVLRAIRNVNQMITKETDRKQLIQGVCDNLVETLGYERVWISLTDADQRPIIFGYAGFTIPFLGFGDLFVENKWVECAENALQKAGLSLIKNSHADCRMCHLFGGMAEFSRFSIRLEYAGKIYGIFSVVVPQKYVDDKEEQELFEELASDIVFALYRIELEEKKEYAEALVADRERTLSTFMNNLPGMACRCLADENWTMKFISNGCRLLTGYWPDDLIDNQQLSYEEIIHPDDRDNVRALVMNPSEETGQFELTYRIMTASGDVRWVWERGCYTGEREGEYKILEGVIHDITEKKEAEERLYQSEQKLKSIFHAAPVGIGLLSDRVFLEVNDQFCTMTGYTREELVGKKSRILYPTKKEFDFVGQEKYEQIRKKGTGTVETRWQRKNGEIIDVLFSSTPIDPSDLLKGVTFTVLDITERKQAERFLKESEEKYRVLVENMSDFVFLIDPHKKILSVNIAASKYLRRDIDQVIGNSIFDLFPTELADKYNKSINRILKTGDPLVVERKTVINNHERWLVASLGPIKDDKGKVTAVIGTSRDITERKEAEQKLRESEARYRAIVEDQSEYIERWMPNGKITFVNESLCKATGKTENDWIGVNIFDTLGKFDRKRLKKKIRGLTPENPFATDEYDEVLSDGTHRWTEWTDRALFDENGKIREIQSVGRDVTEGKKVEDALRKSELLFRTLVNESPIGIYLTDEQGHYQFVNRSWCRMTGLTSEEALGDGWRKALHADDREAIFQNWKKMISERGTWSFQYRFQNCEGKIIWIENLATELRDSDNQITGYIGTDIDITPRRIAEQALREDEYRYRQLFELESDAIFLIDNETGLILEANQAASAMYGYSHEELLVMKNTDLSAEPDKTRRVTETTQVIKDNLITIPLRYHRKKDGTVFTVEITGRFFERKGRPVHIAAIRDMTERLKAEEIFRHEKDLFAKITETGPIAITVVNADGQIVFANRRAEEIFQISKDEIRQRQYNASAWNITDYEGGPFPNEKLAFNLVRKYGKPVFDIRHAIEWPNGQRRLLLINAAPMFDLEGRFEAMVASIEDVTDEKNIQQELLERNIFIQTILDNLPIGIAVNLIDQGTVTYMNKNFEKIYGWPSEIINDVPHFFENVYPNPEYRKEIQERVMIDIQSGDPKRMVWEDIVITKQDGEQCTISAKNIPLSEQNLMISTVWDITERKKAEKLLEEQRQELQNLSIKLIHAHEEERKRLSRELHDQMGQLLTGIKLNVTAIERKLEGQVSDPVQELITETDSLADQLLDQMHDIALELRPNILDDLGLVPTLHWCVKQGQKRWPFTVRLDIADLTERLSPVYETALYRIIQESINNAARHANPETVTVRIKIQDNTLKLSIHDNGSGFDRTEIKSRPAAEQGIGLIGIQERISELGGKLNIRSQLGKGTTISVKLPLTMSAD